MRTLEPFEETQSVEPMSIRTLFRRQSSIHSQHAIANRTIVEIRKVRLRIAHE